MCGVCVCVCVCAYVSVCVSVSVWEVWVNKYNDKNVKNTHVSTRARKRICVYAYTRLFVLFVCVCACVRVCARVRV